MFMFINITNIKHKHKHKHYKLGQGAAYLSALSGDHIVNITFMFINIIIQHYKHKHKHKHYNSGKELLIIQHLMEVINNVFFTISGIAVIRKKYAIKTYYSIKFGKVTTNGMSSQKHQKMQQQLIAMSGNQLWVR